MVSLEASQKREGRKLNLLGEYSAWLVWLVPIASSLLVPIPSRFGERARNGFIVVIGVLTLILSASLVPKVIAENLIDLSVNWVTVGQLRLSLGVFLDPLSVLFANLVAIVGFVVLIYSLAYMAHEEGLDRYYFFILL
ncbi:TPA: hypothetical protein EYP70_00250, partial [Candidatus Bathyarchaeota archaeon]|nr:hypothetical protein [Candidatus Bathyarchaeota archaeon]